MYVPAGDYRLVSKCRPRTRPCVYELTHLSNVLRPPHGRAHTHFMTANSPSPRPSPPELSSFIRAKRLERGWPQAELARRASMSPAGLRWLEDGWRPSARGWAPVRPTKETLRAIATALDISEAELRALHHGDLSPGRRRRAVLRLAVVIPSTPGDPYWAEVTEGIRSALTGDVDEWIIMTFATGEHEDLERRAIDQVTGIGADALVIAPSAGSSWPSPIDRRGRSPIVVIDRQPLGARDPDQRIDVLVPDNEPAVMFATTWLVNAGVKRLGCLAGPLGLTSNAVRFEAVRKVLLDAELLDEKRNWAPSMARPDLKSGEKAAYELLAQHPAYDGFIALNGKMTVALLSVLRANPIVSRNTPLVGYDDALWDCGLRCADPVPSVVRQNPRQLGYAAGRCVLYRLHGGNGDPPELPEPAIFVPYSPLAA